MQTTKDIAAALGCTPQAINKAIRRACKEEGIEPESFGTISARDKRIRTFSESEVETILKYAPAPKPVSESPIVDAEVIEPVTPSGLVVRSPQSLMNFDVQTLNINVTLTNTEALDLERKAFQQQTARALQGLKQIIKDETRATITEAKAQLQHGIAGVQAIALTEAVQELVQPVAQPQPNQTVQK